VISRSAKYFSLILLFVALNGECSRVEKASSASSDRPPASTKAPLSSNEPRLAQKLAAKKEPVADTPKIVESPDPSSRAGLDSTTPNWNRQRGPLPPPNARVRTIHPDSPEEDHCKEWYTGCIGKTRDRCTSMGFFLECGERARHPKTREWVECKCPKRNN